MCGVPHEALLGCIAQADNPPMKGMVPEFVVALGKTAHATWLKTFPEVKRALDEGKHVDPDDLLLRAE
eukprot:4712666-Karenia_brevis.AAC.1